MYFDTHAHYDDEAFDSDRDALLSALPGEGVALVINPGCDAESSERAKALSEKFPFMYYAAGIHPEELDKYSEEAFERIRKLAEGEKCVAIGEIGLDYYWDDTKKEAQKALFVRQIELALSLSKPVIVHDREAHGDSLEIIRAYGELRGVFHCFSGSAEMAKELLRRGWYLGFDGPITYKNAKRAPEVAAITPLDRIVVETDAPYLSPVPFRGKRNDSRYLPYVIEKLAEWKGVTAEEMTDITWENGKRLFGLE